MKQKYRDKIKENRGITIVALVVTIVVLLILASISIQGITKTGIFSSAESVKTEKSTYFNNFADEAEN